MSVRADAATPVPNLALQDLQQLQQLQQQSLSLQQFVLVHPTTSLQPAQLVISQPPQGQQGEPGLLPCARAAFLLHVVYLYTQYSFKKNIFFVMIPRY